MILPPEAHPLVQVLALHFTRPTYQSFSTLIVAAIVTTDVPLGATSTRRTRGDDERRRALHPEPGGGRHEGLTVVLPRHTARARRL